MSKCAGCGEEIGHSTEIVVEYEEEAIEDKDIDSTIQAFGQIECREIFEDHYDLNEDDIVEEN